MSESEIGAIFVTGPRLSYQITSVNTGELHNRRHLAFSAFYPICQNRSRVPPRKASHGRTLRNLTVQCSARYALAEPIQCRLRVTSQPSTRRECPCAGARVRNIVSPSLRDLPPKRCKNNVDSLCSLIVINRKSNPRQWKGIVN